VGAPSLHLEGRRRPTHHHCAFPVTQTAVHVLAQTELYLLSRHGVIAACHASYVAATKRACTADSIFPTFISSAFIIHWKYIDRAIHVQKMDAQNHIQRPAPALQPQFSYDSDRPLNQISTPKQEDEDAEYDPCQNAQKFSPFYLYNHDSPRPSQDLRPNQRPKESLHVDVRDLELGGITPSVTQEKFHAQKKSKTPNVNLKFWKRKQPCLTKPKKEFWLKRLPKKQRIAVKLAIALVIVGAMVGIAVGIAAALHSGVYGTDKIVGKNT